jgi:hypothetical protein
MDQGNFKKADDGLGQSLLVQQQQRQISSSLLFKAPEERPYRRRIKPPSAKVHHVHPARFRRFVQRRTCCSLPPQPKDVRRHHCLDHLGNDGVRTATTTTRCCY